MCNLQTPIAYISLKSLPKWAVNHYGELCCSRVALLDCGFALRVGGTKSIDIPIDFMTATV